ncbi:MAG: hypothetical protein AAF968_11830 [Pseudomonadota bacterium]
MSGRLYITAAEVARILEFKDAAQFQRQRARLVAEHGFPEPVLLMRRPLRWRREDVETWASWFSGLRRDGADQAPAAGAAHLARAQAQTAH